MKKTTIEKALLMFALIACLGFVSCSNDFTDKKEIIQASWRANGKSPWQSIEFDGKHWNGIYERGNTQICMTGTYKWEKGTYKWGPGDYLHLTGITNDGTECSFDLQYVYGSYQILVLAGSPYNSEIRTQFSRFSE